MRHADHGFFNAGLAAIHSTLDVSREARKGQPTIEKHFEQIKTVHYSTQISNLLHGPALEVFGDQAYWNESDRQSAQAAGIR